MNIIKMIICFLKINLQKDMEYNVGFLLSSISSIIWVVIPLIMFNFIFLNIENINGWSWSDMVLLIGVYTLIDSVMMGFLINNMRHLENDIVSGELDRKLIYPIDTQLYYFIRDVNLNQLMNAFFGLILIIYAILIGNYQINLFSLPLFLLFLITGAIIYYSIWFIWVVTAFWWTSSRSRNDLFLNIIIMARYPSQIFHGIGRIIFKFIIPLVFIANPAATIIIGNSTWGNLALTLLISVLFLISNRILWKFGLKKYQGIGQ